jgi:hypothetical protein
MIPQGIKESWQRGGDAWYFDGTVYRKATGHEPRKAIDPGTGRRVYLAEPQRTNHTHWSSDPSQWNDISGATISDAAGELIPASMQSVLSLVGVKLTKKEPTQAPIVGA